MSRTNLMEAEAKQIAQGLRRRDPDLLDALIEQYQYRLFRYLFHITGSHDRAQDFFQETWVRVVERGHQYDGKSKFESWLFRIGRNLVIDWQRRKKMDSLDSLMEVEEGAGFEPPDHDKPGALQQLLVREEAAEVQGALRNIAAIYREVLVLRFQEDLQLEEIASVLAVPVSTAKSRLYRGLEALKQAIATS